MIGKVAKNKEKAPVNEEPEKQAASTVEEETAKKDTVSETEAVPETETSPADETAAKLEELEKQNADLSDKLLRQMAEFDNYRKRTTREKEEIGVVAKSKALTEILPVLDSFERAMQAECADAEFKKGMELIFKSLSDALKKQGIEEIAAEGEVFNPDLHYAVSTVEDEALGTNTVAAVLQKGYRLGDKVLRHAMVSVANP